MGSSNLGNKSKQTGVELLVASSNKNKIHELQVVGERYQLKLISPFDLQARMKLSPPPQVNETGVTYAENALLKAVAFAHWAQCPAIGDDSGLEVDALGGRPGLLSARYGGPGKTDAERVKQLLDELSDLENQTGIRNRAARFCCSLVLAYPEGNVLKAEASLSGEILDSPRGNGGFGYDPIVYLHDLGHTLAEVDFSVTCQSGFRALAAGKLFKQLVDCQ